MLKSMQSLVDPAVLKENRMTNHQYLRQSYANANQHWQDGVSFFKHESSALHRNTRKQANRMFLPINNFLKDISGIEKDLHLELNKEPDKQFISNGKMGPASDALEGPMEENY